MRKELFRSKRGLFVLLGFMAMAALVIMPLGCGGSSSSTSGTTYTVGGTVSDLNGTLVLQNNAGDDLTISADGVFTFATSVADGSTYGVTVLSKPTLQWCTVAHNSGFISGADVADVSVTCGSGTAITISGSVEDADTGAPLPNILVAAMNPADDSTLSSLPTDSSGNFSMLTDGGQDLYLHANGAAVGGTTYVSQNLQILENATDQSGIKIYMIPVDMVTAIAGQIGAEATTDAIFALDVASVNDTLITGVTVAASPSIPNILYQQTSPAGAFTTTPPTTDYDSPSEIGRAHV